MVDPRSKTVIIIEDMQGTAIAARPVDNVAYGHDVIVPAMHDIHIALRAGRVSERIASKPDGRCQQKKPGAAGKLRGCHQAGIAAHAGTH